MSDLKPCPCCGNKHVNCLHDGDDFWTISCTGCGLKTPSRFAQNRAIHCWNNRAAENNIKADAIREAIEAVSVDALSRSVSTIRLIKYADKLERGNDEI